jgi:soluble P-type ATPase
MLEVDIPGRGPLRLVHTVLDVNGTIALDGELLPGVSERLNALQTSLQVHLLTGNTYGRQDELDRQLGLVAVRLASATNQAEEKAEYVRRLGPAGIVAIGNGANDRLMLAEVALGIVVVGPEGSAARTVAAADVVVGDVRAALDLLLHPKRLVATLRQ